MKRFFCSSNHVGKRLDIFLTELTGLTRSQIKKAIDQGRVEVNDKIVTKANYKLKGKERVVFSPLPPGELDITPEPIPLDIIYEDEDLVVLNKPPGLVVHPAPGHLKGTLVHALLYHCNHLSGIGGVKRPGIVHRLDKDTSGLMLVAKNDVAHQELSQQFKERIIKKQYLALVFEIPKGKTGVIDFSLGRHPKERKKISIKTKNPRSALTSWQRKETFPHSALLLCEPQTGRTHQIRVHLSSIGHPILGDPIYFRKSKIKQIPLKKVRQIFQQIPRPMLHSWQIEFIHPGIREKMKFEAPLPADMKEVINSLKQVADA